MTSLTEVEHGKRSTYLRRKCRCEPCKEADREYKRNWEASRERKPLPAESDKHGTRGGYRTGCRCEPCCEANREASRNYFAQASPEQKKAWRRTIDMDNDRARRARKYANNRTAEQAKRREHYAANPDYYKSLARKRQARKRGAAVEFVDRRIVWERDGGTCHICRLPADPSDWHLEHVIPLVAGGEHSYANTAVSHPRCNREKGTSLP